MAPNSVREGVNATLIALNLIVRALEPLARKRGWGSEGRLTRYLSRPRFVDESKRLSIGESVGFSESPPPSARRL